MNKHDGRTDNSSYQDAYYKAGGCKCNNRFSHHQEAVIHNPTPMVGI